MCVSRRKTLALLSSLSAGGLAGCIRPGNLLSDDDELEYSYLRERPVYVSEAIELQLPENVPNVTAPDAADLVVLSSDTEKGAEQIVGWLADWRGVAVFGPPEEVKRTWSAWMETDAYGELAGSMRTESSYSEPAILQARWYDGSIVADYTRAWDDEPDNDATIEGVDSTFEAMERDDRSCEEVCSETSS